MLPLKSYLDQTMPVVHHRLNHESATAALSAPSPCFVRVLGESQTIRSPRLLFLRLYHMLVILSLPLADAYARLDDSTPLDYK